MRESGLYPSDLGLGKANGPQKAQSSQREAHSLIRFFFAPFALFADYPLLLLLKRGAS